MQMVNLVIQGGHGSFLELRNGHPTGREFYLVELRDGTVLSVFSTGENEPACPEMTRAVIDEAVRKGTFVVVADFS